MKPIFRNSMFGFHKEDVYNFISRQSRNYEEKIKELTEENARAVAELEKEKELSLSSTEKSMILSDVARKVYELSSLIEELLRCGELCDLQNKEIKNAFIKMEENLGKAEAFREKAEKFDRLSGVLSSIFADKNDDGENSTTDSEITYSVEKATFPENDGIERLGEVIGRVEKQCEILNGLLSESKADE